MNYILIKRFFLILLTLSLINSCSKEKSFFEYFPNGSIKSKCYIVNGKKDGKYIEYYPSGGKKYIRYYKNGLRNGNETEYYENGAIKRKGQFIDDTGYGFFYYYNNENKIDSLLEFVLLNPDSIMESYFYNDSKSIKHMESCLNRYQIFDKNERPIANKSRYFRINFLKDTVSLGDTIKSQLFFCNPTFNRNNKFEVFIKIKDSFVHIVPEQGNNRIQFDAKTERKGINYLHGYIEEDQGVNGVKFLFFKEKYFVK